MRCKTAGCFDEDQGGDDGLGRNWAEGVGVVDWLKKEAEKEWRFEL